jgi:hypothetical protein
MSMKITAIAVVLLSVSALPAGAGSPPVTSERTPAEVAAACAALPDGTAALDHGCVNTETGAAVLCRGDRCTEYFADPRYAKIRAILEAGRAKPQQRL